MKKGKEGRMSLIYSLWNMKVMIKMYMVPLICFFVISFIWIERPSNEKDGVSFLRNRGVVLVLENVVHGILYFILTLLHLAFIFPYFVLPFTQGLVITIEKTFDFYMNSYSKWWRFDIWAILWKWHAMFWSESFWYPL